MTAKCRCGRDAAFFSPQKIAGATSYPDSRLSNRNTYYGRIENRNNLDEVPNIRLLLLLAEPFKVTANVDMQRLAYVLGSMAFFGS